MDSTLTMEARNTFARLRSYTNNVKLVFAAILVCTSQVLRHDMWYRLMISSTMANF